MRRRLHFKGTRVRILLLLLICWTGLAGAEEAAPLSGEEKQLLDERAKALRDKARILRQEAEAALVVDKKACWDKFLVSACQEDAARTKVERLDAARRIEQEARDIERRLRSRELAEREARMAAEAPQRAAEAAAQAERNRAEQQETLERVERRRREAERREKLKISVP